MSEILTPATDDLKDVMLGDLKKALLQETEAVTEALADFADEVLDPLEDIDALAQRCAQPANRLLAAYAALEKRMEALVRATEEGKRSLSIDSLLSLSRDEFVRMSQIGADENRRVAIHEQIESYRRIDWAARVLGRLQEASNVELERLIYSLRGLSRRQIQRKFGMRGTHLSKSERNVLHLVAGITRRVDALASFIACWAQLNDLVGSTSPEAQELSQAQMEAARASHKHMMRDLGTWVDARSWAVGLA